VPSFVEHHVFGLLIQANDIAAQDRIALDLAHHWEKRSLALACTLDEIDMIITDAAPPQTLFAALKAAKVVVRVASKA
jgi:DeoR/GlpR family transcriptional regulator of sugar metabolism